MRIRTLLIPFCLFLLSACYTVQEGPATSDRSQNVPASADGVKDEEAAIADVIAGIQNVKKSDDYQLRPTDLVEITVYREEDLDRTVRISQTGDVSLPLVGTLKISEMSVNKAESLIASKLGEYIVNPQVTIFIKEYGNKKIYVLGEVKNPGSFDVPPESRLTVLEAVSLAGGFTAVAAKDRTRVIRSGEDGKSQNWTVEVSAITTGEKEKDIDLEPNDVVYVPQSFF